MCGQRVNLLAVDPAVPKQRRRGIAFSASELRLVAERHHFADVYHRELMRWAAKRITALERLRGYLRKRIEASR